MEIVTGSAAGLRRTIQDVAVRLGGSLWAKRCVVKHTDQRLRDIYRTRIPWTSGFEMAEPWGLCLDSELDQAAKDVWDFFCLKPVLPAKDAATGICEAAGSGTIAFMNPDSAAVYLGTTYATVPVVWPLEDPTKKTMVFLSTWGELLRPLVRGGPGPATVHIARDGDVRKATRRMAKAILGIELKEPH